MDQTLDVGLDRGTPVTSDYWPGRGFPFTGMLEEVVIKVGDDAVAASGDQVLKATLVAH